MVCTKIHILNIVLIFNVCISYCNCQKMTGKIVGGDFADIRKFPHAVFLSASCQINQSIKGQSICGSSVLNQKVLLTAAHCIQHCNLRNNQDSVYAFAGGSDLSDEKSFTQRKIINMIVHEKYNETTVQNDIALAEMETPLPLNARIKRVVLLDKFPDVTAGTLAGWGVVDEKTEQRIPDLKYVEQRLMSARRCSRYVYLSPGMMCAGSPNPRADRPAGGDSGSALMVDNYKQIALCSFKDPDVPALLVYSNISFYYNWITKNAKRVICKD